MARRKPRIKVRWVRRACHANLPLQQSGRIQKRMEPSDQLLRPNNAVPSSKTCSSVVFKAWPSGARPKSSTLSRIGQPYPFNPEGIGARQSSKTTHLQDLQNPHEPDAKILPWRTLNISGLLAGLNRLLTRSCLATAAMQRSIK